MLYQARLFNPETVKIHGLLKKGTIEKSKEHEAVIQFLAHINNAVLVAHHAAFDVAMVNEALKRLGLPKLKNSVLDTGHLFKKTGLNSSNQQHFSLDDLSKRFNIPLHDRHTASGDAFITALLFVQLLAFLQKNNKTLSLNYLLKGKKTGLLLY